MNKIFDTRAHVMKSVPFVCEERSDGRLAMDEVLEGWESLCQERGWKLFFLVPRMLLSRPPRGLIPRNKLESSSCSICRRPLD